MLTISVPTYNRPKQILDTVERLITQLDPTCELRVYDNQSTIPAGEILAPLLREHPEARVTVIRNRMNVGMVGNIIRCIEDCPSEWVVMCGDDDPPDPDFVAKTKRAIAAHPDAIYICFSMGHEKRPSTFTTEGLSEFVRGDYVFGTALSLSTGAYRIASVAPFMASAYMYAYTLGPHTALVLATLRKNGGKCVFVQERLCATGADHSLESWSRVWLTSLSLLLELIPGSDDRAAFARKLRHYMLGLPYICARLIQNGEATGSDNSFLFRSRIALRSLLVNSPLTALKGWIGMFLVKHPDLGVRVLGVLSPAKRKTSSNDGSTKNLFDRF